MPPISGVAIVGLPNTGKCWKAVVACLDGEESRRQRPAHGIRRTVVGAASAIGARIEIQHVLPGEVLELLYAERFHLVELLVAYAPAHRLHRSAVQLGEEHVEQRGLDVELNSEWPIAQQEIEGQDIDDVSAEVHLPERRDGDAEPRASFNIHGSDSNRQELARALLNLDCRPAGFKQALRAHQERNQRRVRRWRRPHDLCRTSPERRSAPA